MSEPWEPMTGEGPKPYAAFTVYRDMGPARSIAKASLSQADEDETPAKTKQRKHQWDVWSGCWRWVERARAWDAEMDRQRREANIAAVRKASAQHANLAVGLQSKAFERLKLLDIEELGPKDLLAFIQAGIALERQARGMTNEQEDTSRPTGRIEITGIEIAPAVAAEPESDESEPE